MIFILFLPDDIDIYHLDIQIKSWGNIYIQLHSNIQSLYQFGMEVAVKNTVLAKTYISKFSYNPVKNILACNIDGNDTIQFFSLENHLNFTQLFEGATKPAGSKNSLSWSPDGNYLALGATKMQVWEIKDNRLRPFKSFSEDFIQIKAIQWSVDSSYYACGGISRNNTIKIRTIQNGKVKQLRLPEQLTMSSISFDPFGKYMFVLLRNNNIQVYNTSNFQKQKQINLTPKNFRVNPIKQIRIASWSPNFNTFVCPSLDDSRMSVAFSFARTNDFKLKNVFLGHLSSINCCKFNPRLYRYNDQICSILAMGDSNGTISVWRLSELNTYQEPLLMSHSLQNSMEVAQQLQWNQDGSVLMINMMKKYVNVIKFSKQNFGVELSDDQMISLIQQSYGSKSANDIDKQNIQIFSGSQNISHQTNFNKQVFNPELLSSNNHNIEVKNIHNSEVIVKNKIELASQNAPGSVFQKDQNSMIQESKNISPKFEQKTNIKSSVAKNINEQKMQIQQQRKPQQKQVNLQVSKQPGQIIMIDNSFSNQEIQKEIRHNQKQNSQNVESDFKNIVQASPFNQKVQYLKICEQKTTITKDNKKRIQPSVMVRKDQAYTNSNNMNVNKSKFQNLNKSNQQKFNITFTNLPLQTVFPLKLKVMELAKKQYLLNQNKILSIQRLAKFTVVQIKQSQKGIKIGQKSFNGIIDHIQINNNLIFIVHNGMLYTLDHQFNFEDLPLKIGSLHKFAVNSSGDLYYLNCDGYVYGFNYETKKCYTPSPIPIHFIIKNLYEENPNEESINLNDKIKQFFIGEDQNLYIQINNQKYLFNVEISSWVKLQISAGVLVQGHSLKVTQKQQILTKSFFTNLCPILMQKQTKNLSLQSFSSVICPYQCDLVYYKKYNPNCKEFQNSFLSLIKYLSQNNKIMELRNLIYRYFYNRNSKVYIGKGQFYQKIKAFGGKIIQEFQLNSNLCPQEFYIYLDNQQNQVKGQQNL